MNKVIRDVLLKRGVPVEQHEAFLNPDYNTTKHEPFLLPDMDKAVKRITQAHKIGEKIVIYGDYDVDGMCATAILHDALTRFGLNIETYTPNRFTEGYGLNAEAIKELAKTDVSLVITVDCGSLSSDEIEMAKQLKLDVIVTDHHAISKKIPPAVAVINPHREDSKYPFTDLAGCGVAFKLVQALQTKLEGLPPGQEKWLLDLVALGTVCDIVPLLDENRNNVYWGIEVLKKTRRLGLKSLMAVAKITPRELDSRKIGFILGPRLNASGRMETAQYALELLMTDNPKRALELAQKLDDMNRDRRVEQNRIFDEACKVLDTEKIDDVVVVGNKTWNEGVIGIVASKILEKYKHPTFILQIGDDEIKGSGRSFGDFNLAEAISATKKYLIRGGGHSAAGGISLKSSKIKAWKDAINNYYKNLKLKNQEKYLLPNEDLTMTKLSEVDIELIYELAKLEPFGMGNERPIFKLNNLHSKYIDRIGSDKRHLKLTVTDGDKIIKLLAFDSPEEWFMEQDEKIDLWVNFEINEWQGSQTVEGRILRLEVIE